MALNLRNVKVLVVDDSKPIRDLIAMILEEFGVGKVSTASDGDKGFEVFQKEAPDIVFADWDMAPTNGLMLAQRIRQDPHSINRQVPIIMLTGYTAFFRVLQARESGVTEFMTKPFSADAVAKRISYVINNPRDFIKHPDFTGPDRRRRKAKDYTGGERRRQPSASGPAGKDEETWYID